MSAHADQLICKLECRTRQLFDRCHWGKSLWGWPELWLAYDRPRANSLVSPADLSKGMFLLGTLRSAPAVLLGKRESVRWSSTLQQFSSNSPPA